MKMVFSPAMLDAVREIGTIGTGHAATALSRLTGSRVQMSVPDLLTMPLQEVPSLLGHMGDPAMGVLLPFEGDARGDFLLVFSREELANLELLLFPGRGAVKDDLWESAFRELGNIFTGAFVTVLSRFTDRIIIPQTPTLVQDMAGAVLDTLLAELCCQSDEAVVLSSRMTGEGGEGLVHALLIPDPGGVSLFVEAASRLQSAR